MGKAPDPPAPPDPAETAGAQTAQNVSTAVAQSYLNNANQVTPFGNLTYDQTGSYEMTDPNTGNVYDIPTWTATQELSPTAQRTVDAQMGAQENMAGIARDQSARIGDLLGNPLELTNEAAESRLMELGRKRLDPALDRRREATQNRLAQQGIMPGSEGYDRAMNRLSENENDAYNQLMLQGRGQAMDELLTQRNQPINETASLMSGSQVQQPRFVNTQPAQLGNVDRAGLEMDAYGQRMNAWQAQQAQRNSMMGGLFGLAGNLITASDERVKENVEKVGETDDGQNIYSYNYKGSPRTEMGLMAQEVQRKKPDAVVRGMGGILGVDYGKALQ
jgi:hypothetical protein